MSKLTGAYVPPAKRVKREPLDPGSDEHQRSQWDENKKIITGLINRANTSNVTTIVEELFKCNLVRYKGLFASALIKAQEISPVYTDVYATILAIINSRLKFIGTLVLNRIIYKYRISIENRDKPACLTLVRFIAHLINQDVVHDELAFQILRHLLDRPDPKTIEIAIALLKEAGAKLDSNSREISHVFKILRDLAQENDVDPRTQEMIDHIHLIKKEQYRDYPIVQRDLDLIDEDDKVTHKIDLTDPQAEDRQRKCNYFTFDAKWAENNAKYEDFKKSLLDDADGNSSESEDSSDAYASGDDNQVEDTRQKVADLQDSKQDIKVKLEPGSGDIKPNIIDATRHDLIAFRRTVYLTIKSSVRHEEVVHKLLKQRIPYELYDELCNMILDCCGQERTYESIYGLVAAKFCQVNRREFASRFEKIFKVFYETVHKFETARIRNIAKFYSNLLTTESIDWSCLSCLKLRENATSSAGRCFIKFLFTDLIAILSLPVLLEYIKDRTRADAFSELFPKDEDQDIRFAINFFTCSGFGQLTEELREILVARQQ